MATPSGQLLSPSQMDTLRALGREETAQEGDVLFTVGDAEYPLIAILEGEAAVLDGAGNEIVRHGVNGFLGEMNLLSGQTVYLTAVARAPMRYIAVPRDRLRPLLAEDGPISDLLLSTFMARREALQRRQDVGVEVIGPRGSAPTRELVDRLRHSRSPFIWRDTDADPEAAGLVAGLDAEELPLVRLPGGPELRAPSYGEVWRALGIGLELPERTEVDLAVIGAGPAGLGAAVYGASEGLSTLVIEGSVLGGQAGTSRRIENYLGFPAGISGGEMTTRAVTQARKFGASLATSYRATGLVPGEDRHLVALEEGRVVAARTVVLATGAEYRRLPVDGLEDYEGRSVFYAAGPLEGQQCGAERVGVVGGGNSAAQAAIWLARGGALVTLLHRRGDVRETMSSYLVSDLERFGVQVRDRSEIAELHGEDGALEAVTLRDGERLSMRFLFLFLGAEPCTSWLGDVVARDEKGFVLTGADAGAAGLLETSVPGIFAAGDVRSGSVKRVATAVGDGAMVVRFVHEHLVAAPAG